VYNIMALNYDNIHLIPRYSDLESRTLASTEVTFGNRVFKLPIIPANMETVISSEWANWLSNNDYFYVMHRFRDVTIPFVRKANKERWKTISISTGVNEDSLDELKVMASEGLSIDYITIDVAHGHHFKVQNRIAEIEKLFPGTFIIAGNVTTGKAIKDLELWGANAIKVGIGPGAACTTRLETGFHMPMFSAVLECTQAASVPIIADGGIKHYGDIAKAIVAGATMVMAGSLFASCTDSPAPVVDGKKVYYGSASYQAKGKNKNIEGTLLQISQSSTLEERLNSIKQSLQSSISYGGGTTLSSLKYVQYVQVK
jgi:GMP reductase